MSPAESQVEQIKRFASVEEAYEHLQNSQSKSLLKRHLTKEVFEELKDKVTTNFKSSLLDVIQSGCSNLDSGIGVYAPDFEAYTTFNKLFEPIIKDYHNISDEISHPPMDFSGSNELVNIDPEGQYVISTRCRVARSFEKFPFAPSMTLENYKELEATVKKVVEEEFKGTDLEGKYHSIVDMTKEQQNQLIADHFLFKEGDRFLDAANALKFYPNGRGIFMNNDKTFLIWVGEEDHLRLISMQKGADFGQVISRLVEALDKFSRNLKFAHSQQLGYLTFCPTNLGSTIRASVHVKLPKLAQDMPKFEQMVSELNLQIRGVDGEHSESKSGIFDVSNKRRLGFTESQLIHDIYDGIKKLIEVEKSL